MCRSGKGSGTSPPGGGKVLSPPLILSPSREHFLSFSSLFSFSPLFFPPLLSSSISPSLSPNNWRLIKNSNTGPWVERGRGEQLSPYLLLPRRLLARRPVPVPLTSCPLDEAVPFPLPPRPPEAAEAPPVIKSLEEGKEEYETGVGAAAGAGAAAADESPASASASETSRRRDAQSSTDADAERGGGAGAAVAAPLPVAANGSCPAAAAEA